MGLSAALLVIAAVVLTVVYERLSYHRKQERNRELHDRMGLNTKRAGDRDRP
jgi:hypothetical protein